MRRRRRRTKSNEPAAVSKKWGYTEEAMTMIELGLMPPPAVVRSPPQWEETI